MRSTRNRNLWNALSQNVVHIENINRVIKSLDKLIDNRLGNNDILKYVHNTWRKSDLPFHNISLGMPIKKDEQIWVGYVLESDQSSKIIAKMWKKLDPLNYPGSKGT